MPRELLYEVGDESGPPRLVGGAATAAIVAMEVFVEEDIVSEMRETDLLYLAGLVALCIGGAGPLSVDRYLGARWRR